jgi:hypothetical protein
MNICDFFNITKRENQQGCDLTVRTYQVRSESLDEKTRSIEAVLVTEATTRVFDMAMLEIFDEVLLMSGCRLPADNQMPLLDSHDRSTVQSQLGSVRELRIEGDKFVGRKYYSSSPLSEHAWTLTKEKHLRDNSIGYRVISAVIIEAGEQQNVNGKLYTAGSQYRVRVATEWVPKENSDCAVAADETAKNRSENFGKDKPMEKFKEWLQKRGLKYEDQSAEKLVTLQAEFDAETRAAVTAVKPAAKQDETKTADTVANPAADDTRTQPGMADVARQAVNTERKRVTDIQALAGSDVSDDVISRCISDGSTIEQSRAAVLDEIRKNRPKVGSPAIHTGGETMQRGLLEDALLIRGRMETEILKDKTAGSQRAEKAHKYRDISLVDLCRYALALDGQDIPLGREDMLRAAFSTMSLPIILGNVANKSLLKGYNDVPATWQTWCSRGEAADFKTMTRARLTATGKLEKVGNDGEIKHTGGATEEYEPYNIATYAELFGITRQNIINDDLSAFTRIPQVKGRDAALLITELVYTSLLANADMQDGIDLFHSSHSNLNTTAALAAATLAAAVVKFEGQKDKGKKRIAVKPRYLLVPPELRFAAAALLESDVIMHTGWGTGANTEAITPTKNVLRNEGLTLVSEASLSDSAFTGYSPTSWYLMGDPNVVDTLEVAFLRGKESPTIEQVDPGPNYLGILFRIYHDTGCKPIDWRTMQKNTV